jgi:two-component system NtrC family sensor kinase
LLAYPDARGLMFSTVRSRIIMAMASLVVLLGVASGIAIREVMRLEALSSDVASIDEAVRRLHRVAIAMRDTYAHQAHIAIGDDRSHLDHYGETHEAALRAVDAARAVLDDPEDRARLAGIALVVVELDTSFRANLLPHVPGGGARVVEAHDTLIHLVEDGQRRADELTARLDARARDIRVAVEASREALLGRCAVLFATALLLAAIVALLLDRQVSVPVRSLEAAARRLGEGDLGTRVSVDGDDELGSLARHFNDMAAELQERERRLLEAERLAGVGRLAAGVAHEINNPLSVMLGYVRLIERAATDKKEDVIKADAAMIHVEIERCQHIVAGLLDLARPPRLALTDVSLVELAKDAASPLPGLADGRPRVEVHTDTTDGAMALVDEGKVLQVLRNLLQNAVEAAPDAVVDVSVQTESQRVVVSVKDAGPGLSDDARAHLYEPFFTSKPKGTGLGLAVSRAIAEAHDGTLEHMHSDAGTTFRLTLPRTRPAALKPAAADVHHLVVTT